jgi:hypothetical protein
VTHAAIYILGMSTGVMLALGHLGSALVGALTASALIVFITQESQR